MRMTSDKEGVRVAVDFAGDHGLPSSEDRFPQPYISDSRAEDPASAETVSWHYSWTEIMLQ